MENTLFYILGTNNFPLWHCQPKQPKALFWPYFTTLYRGTLSENFWLLKCSRRKANPSSSFRAWVYSPVKAGLLLCLCYLEICRLNDTICVSTFWQLELTLASPATLSAEEVIEKNKTKQYEWVLCRCEEKHFNFNLWENALNLFHLKLESSILSVHSVIDLSTYVW